MSTHSYSYHLSLLFLILLFNSSIIFLIIEIYDVWHALVSLALFRSLKFLFLYYFHKHFIHLYTFNEDYLSLFDFDGQIIDFARLFVKKKTYFLKHFGIFFQFIIIFSFFLTRSY